jgi:hypothetical protein
MAEIAAFPAPRHSLCKGELELITEIESLTLTSPPSAQCPARRSFHHGRIATRQIFSEVAFHSSTTVTGLLNSSRSSGVAIIGRLARCPRSSQKCAPPERRQTSVRNSRSTWHRALNPEGFEYLRLFFLWLLVDAYLCVCHLAAFGVSQATRHMNGT